jgi:hypothetical protein
LKHKQGKHHTSSSSHHHRDHGGSSDKTGGSGSSKDKGGDKGGKDKGGKDKGGKDKRVKEMDKDKDKSGDVKRDKFLERNRVAASKCRQKKKEWVNDLEDQKFGLESQNSHLQMEYNGLLGEVSRMKNQIMAHANCKDRNIDKWIENEARRFVQTTSERYDREQRRYPSVPGSAGGGSMYPMEAPTPSYASSSYQNDDGEYRQLWWHLLIGCETKVADGCWVRRCVATVPYRYGLLARWECLRRVASRVAAPSA